jgi:AraC-like DNA-binding protein
MTELSTGRDAAHQTVTATVVTLLDNARLALNSNRAAAESWIVRASAMVQAEADGRTADHEGRITAVRGGLAPWQLRRVMAHIDSCLAMSIRLRDFNQITGLSTAHFARAFKVSVGDSVHAYIIRRRIEHARKLMLTTDDSLAQIALACGLSDQAHLCRLFRRIVGASPFAWRRQWRGDACVIRESSGDPYTDPYERHAGRDHFVTHAPAPQRMPQRTGIAA